MPPLRRTGPLALALLLVAPPTSRAAAQEPGITLVYRTTFTGTGPMVSAMPSGTSRVLAQDGRTRVERDDSVAHPPMPARSVMLTLDGGARTVVLDPARHEYFALDLAGAMRHAAEMQRAAGIETRLTDPTVRVEHVGPGEPVLGQPTDRWRISYGLTITVGAGGGADAAALRTDVISDFWYGDTDFPPPTAADAPNASMAQFADTTIGRRLAQASSELPHKVALRSTSTMTRSQGGGGTVLSQSTMTSEVVALTRGPLAPSLFEIPADYREVPWPLKP